MEPLKLTPATGGWVHADWGRGKAWVRLGTNKRNQLTRITGLHVVDPTPEKLRRIPLRRIHAAATMRGAGFIQLMVAMGLNEDPPDFDESPKTSMDLSRRFRLKRPPGKALDDSFYRDVAHAYQSAVAFGLNPRQAIVRDTGAADATVAAWVGEARRRGYLPPAKPGKVSA